jgi:hypothetical protein
MSPRLAALLAALAFAPALPAQPVPAVPAPTLKYRSALEGWRAHAEQPVTPWRDANDLVGRIGGWQAYAREAAGTPAPAASAPAHRHHKP